mgnify:CR=1 FL=1
MRPTPRVRALSHQSPEQLAEVRLVGHSALSGDLAQGFRGGQHQPLRTLHAPTHDIGMRGMAEAFLERPAEVAVTEASESREIFQADRRGEMLFDMGRYATDLPGRESSARRRPNRPSRFATRRSR